MLDKLKKIPYLSLVPIIFISLVLYKIVNNPSILSDGFNYLLSVFNYIIWAFAIAYLLNPMMVWLEKKLKLRRVMSILVIYAIFLIVIAFAIIIITPILVNSIIQLGNNTPQYIDKTENWVVQNITHLQTYDKYGISSYIQNNFDSLMTQANTMINKITQVSLNFLLKKTWDLTSTIISFVFGFFISIYLLTDKEKIIEHIKSFLCAFFSDEHAGQIVHTGRKVNAVFAKYIIGKLVDSAIIGSLCFLGLVILKVPFALLISIMIGLTNVIPYIGGIIGLIPSVIIILFVSPIKALWVLIFLVLLQQFDGWILSPKIIGDKVGLNPLLIIIALLIGGALYGVIGMFIAIPMMGVLKEFTDSYIDRKIALKQAKEKVE